MKLECVEYPDGTKEWCLNGQRHREDGPAVEYSNGNKSWYLHGLLHREDGPAIEWADGSKVWYLNGCEHTKDAYWREVFRRGLIDNKRLFVELL